MIYREDYLLGIQTFINKPQVKIITGVRRSGKSTVLNLLKQELQDMGIKAEQIILST